MRTRVQPLPARGGKKLEHNIVSARHVNGTVQSEIKNRRRGMPSGFVRRVMSWSPQRSPQAACSPRRYLPFSTAAERINRLPF